MREELRGRINFERTVRIAGSDGDGRAVSIARSNIERLRDLAGGKTPERGIRSAGPEPRQQIAGLPGLPELRVLPMNEAASPFPADGDRKSYEPAGCIVTNPPYGKRLGDRAASEKIYGEMAALRTHFPGWKLALITDHSGFESFFGAKADSCREISNGAIPSYFFQYEVV